MLRRSIGSDYAGLLRKYILPLPQSSTTATTEVTTTVDDEALDRILAAVGKPFIPSEVNKNSLRTALNEAAEGKEAFDRIRSGPRTRALIKAVVRIGRSADRLAKEIKENDDASQFIADAVPDVVTTISELIEYAGLLERRLSEFNALIRARHDRIPSPGEWLAGVELPNIFEEFFDRKAGRSRNNNAPSGPTVCFIIAVMREIGCPSKPETIVRAMTMYSDLRKGRAAVRKSRGHIGKK